MQLGQLLQARQAYDRVLELERNNPTAIEEVFFSSDSLFFLLLRLAPTICSPKIIPRLQISKLATIDQQMESVRTLLDNRNSAQAFLQTNNLLGMCPGSTKIKLLRAEALIANYKYNDASNYVT